VGQTQILLLVLVLVIIGIAIMVAVYAYNDNLAAANLDRVSSFLLDLGMRAQKYYRTPEWLDGGGHSFTGLSANAQGIAFLTNIPVNGDGAFSIITSGNASKVTLQGIGTIDGDGDGQDVTVTMEVFADTMSTTIVSR
jgi:hypothetical protein